MTLSTNVPSNDPAATAGLALKVDKAGDTMTGALEITAASGGTFTLNDKHYLTDTANAANSIRRLLEMKNSNGVRTTFVRELVESLTTTAGAEQARYTLEYLVAGVLTVLMQADSTGIAFTKPLLMNGQLINNLSEPNSSSDAATKNYVDTAIAAVSGGLEVYLAEHVVPNGGETSFTFSGLDGDTQETYILRYMLIKGTAASFNIYFKPNASSNLFHFTQLIFYGAGSNGFSGATNSDIDVFGNNSGSQGDTAYGEIIFNAKRESLASARCVRVDNAERHQGTGGIRRLIEGNWENVSTQVTSLQFLCDVASGIGEGSYVRLYKRKKQ